MVSPSPTETRDAWPFTAGVTDFGWLRLGAGDGAGAMYTDIFDPLPLPVELPPLDGAPPPWQWYSPVFLLVWQPLASNPPAWGRAYNGANLNATLAISVGQGIGLPPLILLAPPRRGCST